MKKKELGEKLRSLAVNKKYSSIIKLLSKVIKEVEKELEEMNPWLYFWKAYYLIPLDLNTAKKILKTGINNVKYKSILEYLLIQIEILRPNIKLRDLSQIEYQLLNVGLQGYEEDELQKLDKELTPNEYIGTANLSQMLRNNPNISITKSILTNGIDKQFIRDIKFKIKQKKIYLKYQKLERDIELKRLDTIKLITIFTSVIALILTIPNIIFKLTLRDSIVTLSFFILGLTLFTQLFNLTFIELENWGFKILRIILIVINCLFLVCIYYNTI